MQHGEPAVRFDRLGSVLITGPSVIGALAR